MIGLEKAQEPAALQNPRYAQVLQRAKSHYELDIRTVRQSRPQFDFFHRSELKRALLIESHGKCAYCEQLLDPEDSVIDRFRPSSGAVDASGTISSPHYWWLAYDWNNLFPSCQQCNFFKGNNFPVVNERIPVGVHTDFDAVEVPLIINPFRLDPSKHLEYTRDGRVIPLSLFGEHTIATIKLNRSPLLLKREQALAHFSSRGESWIENSRASREFAGMARYFALLKGQTRSWPVLRREEPSAVKKEASEASPPGTPDSFPLVSSITISGLFGLGDIEVSIPYRSANRAPCIALVGENGTGKTSILKAIAVAMYDSQSLVDHIDTTSMLTHPGRPGELIVRFDNAKINSAKILPNGKVKRRREESNVTLLAYGATRLQANAHHIPPQERNDSRALNLFDPFSPLRESAPWLMALPAHKFDYAAAAIKKILDLPDEVIIDRPSSGNEEKSIHMLVNGERRPVSTLSHGYKAMLGLACDIMQTMFDKWEDSASAEGIVIIDEIENHLHPVWKMRIVPALRDAFPRIQFITTTHDPLCLQDFDYDEISIITRSSSGGASIRNAPKSTDMMRIDEVLTSPNFGLGSTLSLRLKQTFDEYYGLLDSDNPNPDRLRELELQVASFDAPHLLERDRIMYKVIDKFIATRRRGDQSNLTSEESLSLIESLAESMRDNHD
ncbi:MAG: AAA family ATPase [Stenotrophomonas maltophilia]|uniref:AAA family ATPase n=1 Tax=Stenotrophomonas TaxID=40323 RepID=UPI0013122858|nr:MULTISPECIES: AAA family ATPase [Stenotrophomonas]MBS4800122.1 AAA family ATPase [Stenotrophomonas maltophilia]MDG9988891.1 AAA family ATPase [Stenotrophomonas sp. GD04024]